MRADTRWTLLAAMAIPVATCVFAQCPVDWFPGSALPGANGVVRAFTKWDPDGPGPRGELLVAGGEFTVIGDTTANRIAAWDGQTWYPFGAGMNDWVMSLAVVNGDLCAGGYFTQAGGVTVNRVARWTGGAWQALGGGVNGPSNPNVTALAEFNGQLVAGGIFNQAGTATVSNIASWNGSQWQALGSGVNSYCYALTNYGGELVAGGGFNMAGGVAGQRIAAWNGQSWHPLGAGVTGSGGNEVVRAMIVHDGGLSICGDFQQAGGTFANGVARWDGNAWSAYGFGTGGINYTLTTLDNRLVANARVHWTGAAWEPLTTDLPDNDAFASIEYHGDLIAGGRFYRVGNRELPRIARVDGTQWQAIEPGVDGWIEVFLSRTGDVVVGGYFSTAPDGTPARNIVRWDGAAWHALGDGLPGVVFALTEYQGDLIAGSDRIYRWNGTSWQALNSSFGGGSVVYALAEYDGELIAGGTFNTIDGVVAYGVAAWNGIEWHPLGGGIMGEEVFALLEYNGELIAGGDFWQTGSVGAWNVAAWNGTTWRNLAQGLSGIEDSVKTLAIFEGGLVAGGYFESNNAGGSRPHVARWTGAAWDAIGAGLDRPVNRLTVHEGQLFAGGLSRDFPGTFRGVAGWDGATWTNVGGGTDSDVRGLASFGDDLLVGGVFSAVGNRSSARFARWGERLAGDLDIDGDVDLYDLARMLSAFGTCPLDAAYDRSAGELTGDPCVLLDDLALLLSTFGRACD